MPNVLFQIRNAVVAARAATGDASIATRVQGGKIQVGTTINVGTRGGIHFQPSTGWLSPDEAIQHLETLRN